MMPPSKKSSPQTDIYSKATRAFRYHPARRIITGKAILKVVFI